MRDQTGEIAVEVSGADVDNAPVLAEASDRGGRLAMMKPADGKFMISTRTEEELRASRRGFVNVARVLAIMLAAVGVVLVVLGLVL